LNNDRDWILLHNDELRSKYFWGFFPACATVISLFVPFLGIVGHVHTAPHVAETERLNEFFMFLLVYVLLAVVFNTILMTTQHRTITSVQSQKNTRNAEKAELWFMVAFFGCAVFADIVGFYNSLKCNDVEICDRIFQVCYIFMTLDCILQLTVFHLHKANSALYSRELPDHWKLIMHGVKSFILTYNIGWNIFMVCLHLFFPWEYSSSLGLLAELFHAGSLAFRLHTTVNSLKHAHGLYDMHP